MARRPAAARLAGDRRIRGNRPSSEILDLPTAGKRIVNPGTPCAWLDSLGFAGESALCIGVSPPTAAVNWYRPGQSFSSFVPDLASIGDHHSGVGVTHSRLVLQRASVSSAAALGK